MDINTPMCHHLPVGWGRVSVHPAVFSCPGSTLPDLGVVHHFPLGQGQSASSSAGAESWPEAPHPAPRHEPARPGWGHGPSSAWVSLASRFRAEEDGLPVLEGTGRRGPGKHIAKGWVWRSLSLTPATLQLSHPVLQAAPFAIPAWPACPLLYMVAPVRLSSSCGQRSMVQGLGSSTALPEDGSESQPLPCFSFPIHGRRSPG